VCVCVCVSLSLSLYFAEVFLLLRLSTPKLLPKLRTKAAESKIRRRPVRHNHSPIIRKQNQKNLTSSSRDRRTHPPQTAALDLKPRRRQDTPGCSLKSVFFFPEIPCSHLPSSTGQKHKLLKNSRIGSHQNESDTRRGVCHGTQKTH
jgi:hypothetical protein